MREILDSLCHRNPGRSLPFADGEVLLCARCTGVYLGALAGALAVIAFLLAGRRPRGKAVAWSLVAGMAATPAEVLVEGVGLAGGSNALRLALGLLTGSALLYALGMALPLGRRAPLHSGFLAGIAFLDAILLICILYAARWGGTSALFLPFVSAGLFVLVSGVAVVLVCWGSRKGIREEESHG